MRHNAASEKQVKRRQQDAKARRERDDADLRELLKLPAFRRYALRQMCVGGGLFQSAFNGSGSVVYFNIGRQDFAREMWAEIERADPAAIPLMLTEQQQAQASERTLDAAKTADEAGE